MLQNKVSKMKNASVEHKKERKDKETKEIKNQKSKIC